ncbi:MAG TPA: aminotransferase class III-fold pyridoxal phosphate-dependent enzyme [Ohtaekwangia sp.]|nr:aminotransferase class III-fold pyridoxal phosphate-dependent enzyme [Ohtaekwangia sp.]
MTIQNVTRSESIIARSAKYLAGGVVSLNRKVNPNIVFDRAAGSRLYDAEGNVYIDYHAAFAPFLLGHNFEPVNRAAMEAIAQGWSLMGSGTTLWESQLAELLCAAVPSLERVQITNTGSEATAHAIRLSRAYTAREDIIVTLGGYNGWHNEVARSVMPSLQDIGPRVSPGEYAFHSMSAGIPENTRRRVHVVNFNDLESVEYVMKRYPVACVLTEPVLQNVGIIKPVAGYLEGLVKLCDAYGAVCIFDEVKTGFRAGLGGYQGVCGVTPHLSVFGKAVANGYPLGVIGGKNEIMQLFDAADPAKRVLIAGTYNAHPVNTAAAIATVKFLNDAAVYQKIENTCKHLYDGLNQLFQEKGRPFVLSANASAFCLYFCEKKPDDLHDILLHHDFAFDIAYRRELIKRGVYHIPLACKQGSVSYAHTAEDIDRTLEITREALSAI